MATSPATVSRRSLPDGWRWARLGNVCRVVGGSTPKSGVPNYWDGNILWVTPTDLGRLDGNLITSSARRITQAGYDRSGTEMVPPGTVVLSSRAPIGHLGIAGSALCTNQGCKSFVPGPDVDSAFLYFALKSAVPVLKAMGSGAIFAEVSKSQLQEFEVPLPPLPEQRRIAALLATQMAAVERARRAAAAQVAAARALPAAYLREVFESADAQRWPRIPLGEAGVIVSGITLGRKLNGAATREVPYLRVANVKDGYLDLADVYTIEATEAEIQKCRLQCGDLLLTEGGDADKLGRGTFWEEQIPNCIHQNHIFRVRFDRERFSPQFVAAQVGSSYGKAYFLAHAKQTTGIATINQGVLSRFPLMAPSLDEQRRTMAKLGEQLAAAERVRSAAAEQLAAINHLPAALLRRAFAGEL
ncbi:MAG TPA: restriction endonuclease subunit S [Thermomicrobiales bacterium]|nr:restriction endonuclease subunit S [Thermomicrobiales bacterium]